MAEIPTAPIYTLTVEDVCNNALGMIGQQEIGSLNEASAAARECRRQFPTLLSAMLRDHDWNFASRRVYLPQIDPDLVAAALGGYGSGGFGGGGFGGGTLNTVLVTEPSGGFAYWYALPANFLRAWQINNTDDEEFIIEFGALQTDASSALLRYTAYIDDPNLWDAMFRIGMETYLAARIAGRLTGDLQLAARLQVEALGGGGVVGLFSQAKAVVGQEGSTSAYISDNLTRAREW